MKIKIEQFYKLLAPRPVVLVSTVGASGVSNAAPFSFVTPLSMDPPLLAFASNPAHDTVRNIQKTKDFVVNIPGKELLKQLWQCRQDFPYGVSEIKAAKLSEERSIKVRSPKIKECLAHFECKLFKQLKSGDHLLIVGKVLAVSLKDKLFKHNQYQIEKAYPLMHIGSEKFGLLGKTLKAE